MDGVNVQHLVEKLVDEWDNLETADREAALGWARDAGRSFDYDVREVLGLTGVPGQNGWKARPKLPRDWPPPQLAKGKLKAREGQNPPAESRKVVPEEGKRSYLFGTFAQQLRADKQGRSEQQERSVERQPELGAEDRGREVQRERREERQPEPQVERRGREVQVKRREERQPAKQRDRREVRHSEGVSKAFKLVPAQEVERDVKEADENRSGKRRTRSEESKSRATISLKGKRQRCQQVRKDKRSGRSGSRQRVARGAKAQESRQGRQSRSKQRARLVSVPSPSSSLDRLLHGVESSSDDHIESKVMEVKRSHRMQAEAQRRAEEAEQISAGRESMDAPNLFKRLRKSGMTPLQVGKVAAELQVLALAVESKGETHVAADDNSIMDNDGNATKKGPCPLSVTLTEVLSKESSAEQTLCDAVPGRVAAKSKDKRKRAVTKPKEKVEELAQRLNKVLREGGQSERARWDALDTLINCLPMAKTRNGVKIMQFGAMRARGRQHAAADANLPNVADVMREFIRTHGPVPVRHLAWGQFSVACIKGRCSQFHVDPQNGLTFTACSNDGLADARLEYEDGTSSLLGSFWTEIMPAQLHRVVASMERTALSVYLPPLRGYSSIDTCGKGPTQIVLRCSDSKGETQHEWPHNASAGFLLSQSLKQLGKIAVYEKVSITLLDGRKLGMDDIVPTGSTVLAVLEQVQPTLQLKAGGKWGNPQVSDGEVIKRVRLVRPQLEPQQVKALLGGSPKLAKFVQSNGYGQQLLDLVLHEEKRQGLAPKLGWQRDLAGGKTLDGQEGWQQVARKNKSKPKQQETPPVVKRTMPLQAAQVVCDGRPLPVREVLLHGYGGVCIVRTKEELVKLAKLHKADGRTPQVAVAATKYDLTEEEKRSLVQTPVETSLRFRIKEEGQENDKEATTRCCIYPLTAKQVLVVHAQEHSLALVDKEVMKVQVNPRVQCGKGVWVPKEGDLATLKKFVKQLAPEAYELVVESWKPKLLEGPALLMKVKAGNANKVASKLTDAGFSVTPSKAVQAGTKVAWTKAESLEEAVKLTKEALKDLPVTKQIPGTVVPWSRESALFIKGSTGKGGQASFGIRLPSELHATVQERLGRDARKMYTLAGAPRSWMQDDIANCLAILQWEGEVKYAARGHWFIRAASDPGRWTAVVGVGYERCTLRPRVEDLTLAKEHRLKAKEAMKAPVPSRNDTWKTLLKALPLPADAEHADSSEQPSTETPWSAWDASAVPEEDTSSQVSLDDEWCEEDEAMADDWLEDEPQDRFETRKRRANEQRQAEPTQETAGDPHKHPRRAQGGNRPYETREAT
eukprot:3275065-Amphidinium_carterae.2